MARWSLTIEVDREAAVPLYLQIARAIAEAIRRGRLRAGARLPGSRTLARSLGVQRLTVVAAYDELAAEGWIVARPARGAFVSPQLPEVPVTAQVSAGVPRRLVTELAPVPELALPYDVPKGALLFAPNRADLRLIPADLIGRAYRRAIQRGGGVLMGYGRPQGHQRLREALAEMLASTRGIAASPDDVCVTRGSQMAMALLAGALIRAGDIVLVEELSYARVVEVFRHRGATVVPVPIDEEGIRTDAVERIACRSAVRVAYVTPHHQFPTTVTLSAARRLRLLDLARRHRFVVLEEDYDHEFHYEGAPVLPLASADRWGVVAYVGTLSKVLAPALRIGYVVAPPALVRAVAAQRLYLDVQGDRVLEYAVAELMEEGEIQRHIRRVRREYHARRDALVAALRTHLAGTLRFTVPAGGIGLWAGAADGIDVDAWASRARGKGAVVATGRRFAVDGAPRPFFRLGFASLQVSEIIEGVRRLRRALP